MLSPFSPFLIASHALCLCGIVQPLTQLAVLPWPRALSSSSSNRLLCFSCIAEENLGDRLGKSPLAEEQTGVLIAFLHHTPIPSIQHSSFTRLLDEYPRRSRLFPSLAQLAETTRLTLLPPGSATMASRRARNKKMTATNDEDGSRIKPDDADSRPANTRSAMAAQRGRGRGNGSRDAVSRSVLNPESNVWVPKAEQVADPNVSTRWPISSLLVPLLIRHNRFEMP